MHPPLSIFATDLDCVHTCLPGYDALGGAGMPGGHVEVRGQLCRAESHLPPLRGSHGLNSGREPAGVAGVKTSRDISLPPFLLLSHTHLILHERKSAIFIFLSLAHFASCNNHQSHPVSCKCHNFIFLHSRRKSIMHMFHVLFIHSSRFILFLRNRTVPSPAMSMGV